ncbi:MAG: DNA recombination protein RmuC [Gammaproteobacteria bacterium]|nr:DNA recombination protein RmuC [Gammaproteobacteria bacterium]
MLTPIVSDIILVLLLLVVVWLAVQPLLGGRNRDSLLRLDTRLDELGRRITAVEQRFGELKDQQNEAAGNLRQDLLKQQVENLNTLKSGVSDLQKQTSEVLKTNSEELGKRMDALAEKTDKRLESISGQVEKRLSEGFEKTTATFSDILKRLALIDEAQKKITELSSNVVSLQEVLSDKRSRGTFGEVQLASLIRNVLPESSFSLQHTLSNGTRVDCMLFLPEPTGNVAIDSKFPLESYRRMTDFSITEAERITAERQFKQDVRKHIQDIAGKYILPGETSDGAVMFIPAEAVFSEIQAHHPDLVEQAHAAKVWMVSPTTMWATLNTARAVLKDAATREQVHIIQEHLGYLAKDFERFRRRMDDLSKHIEQAHKDVENVNTSARKITSRFEKIEKVELERRQSVALGLEEEAPDGTAGEDGNGTNSAEMEPDVDDSGNMS